MNFSIEAVKHEVISAEKFEVKKLVVLSTDKAAYPINAMGMTKALMEKTMMAAARNLDDNKTVFSGTRYGNVMASRGSVIPLFIDQIKKDKPLTITNPNMTRFMMTLDDAVDLVQFAFENGSNGDLFVQKSPAATIDVLAKALIELYNSKSEIQNIGIRHGEKMYETLVTKEEMIKSKDLGDYFKIRADNRDLNYDKYFSKGDNVKVAEEYNSDNTKRLSVEEMKKLLQKLPEIQADLA